MEKTLSFKISEDKLEELRARAKRLDLSMGAYVRMAVFSKKIEGVDS